MQAQHKRRWLWAEAAVIGAAVVVRTVLPLWVARELNRRLDTIGQYHGQLDSVDLQLWRGAYTIHALNIVKRGGDVPVPLLDGGHLLYFLIEAIRGRPLSQRVQEIGFRFGLALVFTLTVFTLYNDIF